MIPCVPDPYPGELLYSIWARCSDRVQYPNKASILHEMFGKGKLNPIIDLPCHLKHFVDNLPHGQNYTADYFIDCHTLLPFYSPFLPKERLNYIREQMLTHNTAGLHRRAGIGSGSKPLSPNWLRYCPLCVKEERENLGECYWHRLHQIPGVEICSTHMVFLENSTIRARRGLNGSGIFSAESTIRNITPRTATSFPFLNALMEIATDAQYLLEHRLSPRESLFFRQQYHSLLAQEGFMTQSGRIRVKDYLKAFTEYYSQELLTTLQCDIKTSVPVHHTWLAEMTHLEQSNSDNAFHHPLYQILAIRFLHTTVESFFLNDFIAPTHFGPGPWPCLNPVCDHYRQKNILSYQLAKARTKGKVVGIFTCSCGFKYSRIGPDASPDDVFRKSDILSYGDLWETKLRELWSDPTKSYNNIASCLGISFTKVRSHAIRLHLAIPRGSSTFSQAEITQNKTKKDYAGYRSKWLTILKEAPEEPIYKLRRRAKGVYTWLYRHDHEWLLAHSLSRNTEGQSRVQKSTALQEKQQQEDAINRDALMVSAIRNVAGRLMHASGALKRVSITSICREIPQLKRIPQSNESTLITQTFQEVIETFEAFAVRRIKYVLQKYIEEQVIPTRNKFIRRANLSKEILQNPLVRQTLDEALFIVSQLR